MKDRLNRWLAPLDPRVRRALVFVIGMTLLLAGVAMLVLPGPGIVVILIALALLATEFAWAQTLLVRARQQANRAANRLRGRQEEKGER
jgi:uncharacterized protein (TIGR02611 family)